MSGLSLPLMPGDEKDISRILPVENGYGDVVIFRILIYDLLMQIYDKQAYQIKNKDHQQASLSFWLISKINRFIYRNKE